MSRPPHPHSARSTRGEQPAVRDRLEYLPLAYAEMLALQEDLAVSRLNRPRRRAGDDAEADLARTFMELSALVAHILSVYQGHYAAEAFISTAQTPGALIHHARRLAYDPDPGLAASGYAVLFAKERASGTVAAGLALASVPLGEITSQDYETRDDLAVDAVLNEIVPVDAERPVKISKGASELLVRGVGHRLEAGDLVALVGPHWDGFVVQQAIEDHTRDVTLVLLDQKVGSTIDVGAGDAPPMLLAHPTRVLRPFGINADPALFPPAQVVAATNIKPQGGATRYWYAVERADGKGYSDSDIYLSEQVNGRLAGGYVLRSTGKAFAVLKVTEEIVAAVTLHRETDESFTSPTVTIDPKPGGGFTSTLNPGGVTSTVTQTIASHVSGTVTAIRVAGKTDVLRQSPLPFPVVGKQGVLGRSPLPFPVVGKEGVLGRRTHPFPAEWLANWDVEAPLAASEPNPAPVTEPLKLPGVLPALTPGRPLIFSDRAGTAAQIVVIRRADPDTDSGITRIWWDPLSPPPPSGWQLGDLKVFGNVVRVTHGRTVRETLGGSDGVTPFQRFQLRESPVTVLAGVAGGEPEIEVRVDDVRWQRVMDFASSGPDDRHYRTVTDEQSAVSVMFGDGRNGAVPSSGRKNITAVYRVGLGRAGDVEPPRVSRIKQAHPLLDRVVNVTPISGGTQPAGPDAIRSQSPRWIRTFDRAVSVADLADLALTMPGIARTAARWEQSRGAVLVVATEAGETPAALDEVRAFLDARRDVTIPLILQGPQPRDVFLDVDVDPDPAYSSEIVLASTRDALHGQQDRMPGMFTFPARELGQPAYLSEVYARLAAIPGVVGVRVSRFGSRDGTGLADVVPAGVEEWLRLQPHNLTAMTSALKKGGRRVDR